MDESQTLREEIVKLELRNERLTEQRHDAAEESAAASAIAAAGLTPEAGHMPAPHVTAQLVVFTVAMCDGQLAVIDTRQITGVPGSPLACPETCVTMHGSPSLPWSR